MAKIQTDRSLGHGEKPEIRSKYVHMMPEDHDTWTAFLQSSENDLIEVWYDVHVGRPMDVPPGSPEYMLKVVEGVSRKRIDVVGRTEKGLYIIEVKPHANMEAIGQVVTYANLFIQEFIIEGPIQGLIVATTCDADILEIAQRMGVKIIALRGTLL